MAAGSWCRIGRLGHNIADPNAARPGTGFVAAGNHSEVSMASTPAEPAPLIGQPSDDRLFPTLTPEQIERLSAFGHRRLLAANEAPLEPGMRTTSIFVVLRGALVIVRSSCDGEAVVARVEPGRFTGEVSVLAGQPSMSLI